MKRFAGERDWPRIRAEWRRALVTGRAFLILSCCSMVLFVLLGIGGVWQKRAAASPALPMKGLAASLTGQLFQAMLGAELPRMEPDGQISPLQTGQIAVFLLRLLSDLNPRDPRSLLAAEMPGLDREHAVLLRAGQAEPEAPVDYAPLPPSADASKSQVGMAAAQKPYENRLTETKSGSGGEGNAGDGEQAGSAKPDPAAAPAKENGANKKTQPFPPATPLENSPGSAESAGSATDSDTGAVKTVFIYHSHNRESWYPELKDQKKDPNSDEINITLVGKRLAEQLERHGVGSVHSEQDYATSVKDYNWNYSYKYSLQTVRDAMAEYGELKILFDIHRDSQRRAKTTATIDGVDYAQVYFIIGHRNPDWRENEAFANRLHERLERDYPGLSRGVWGKTAANGNGEYNQSVSPGSVLLEIGGVDNTLEECYRTAEALAEAVAELLWEQSDAVEAGGRISATGAKG